MASDWLAFRKTSATSDDWLENKRPYVTDKYDREPLLAFRQGRLQKTTLQTYVYRWTRPCAYGQECPHDRDPKTCEATVQHAASKCPSSVSLYAIRRGSITHSLNHEMSDKIVNDRAKVSAKVIDQHYDRRTEQDGTVEGLLGQSVKLQAIPLKTFDAERRIVF